MKLLILLLGSILSTETYALSFQECSEMNRGSGRSSDHLSKKAYFIDISSEENSQIKISFERGSEKLIIVFDPLGNQPVQKKVAEKLLLRFSELEKDEGNSDILECGPRLIKEALKNSY